MEPDIRIFLKKVAQTIFGGLLWMVTNTTLGIMFELGFPEGPIKVSNILFYIWAVVSLVCLLFWYYKMWSKKDEELHPDE
jgi:membrane protein DedA with SNARE-associated domain